MVNAAGISSPKYQRVSAELRRAILERHYQPGEKLPPDAQLAERFGARG
jgi:DNA-binding GntR family transcriptional regulator